MKQSFIRHPNKRPRTHTLRSASSSYSSRSATTNTASSNPSTPGQPWRQRHRESSSRRLVSRRQWASVSVPGHRQLATTPSRGTSSSRSSPSSSASWPPRSRRRRWPCSGSTRLALRRAGLAGAGCAPCRGGCGDGAPRRVRVLRGAAQRRRRGPDGEEVEGLGGDVDADGPVVRYRGIYKGGIFSMHPNKPIVC